MTYVHPQLITAHAPTIGAMHPTRNRDKDLADAIALEQIRSQNRIREIKAAQGGVVQPPTPSRKNRQVISVAETKADVFGKSVPGLRREIARIAPGGGMGVARSARGGDSDYKVTGTSIFNRPDDDSVWRDDLNQWIRPWLPGEKEAEALRRTGEVQNELAEERELTAQGRRERAALVNDVVGAIKQGRFSREEMPKLLERFGDAEDTIRMADALRDREPSPEEKFRKNTFTDANGVVFSTDGKVLYNPNDTAMRRDEFAAKREDALKARADKYELELRKPVVSYDSDGVKQSTMRTDEEIQQLMQRRFPELYPSAPQTQGAQMPVAEPPPTEDPNDPLAAFKKFRN